MKVFISWSGERSKLLAEALREWLPLVLQYAEPWVSDKDISAGDRWAQAIAGELENSNFGIICVTPENLSSEWILFEAGALSKSMQDGKVIPLLFGLELSDISGPLAQFQAKKADQEGLMEVAKAMNKVSDSKTSNDIVKQLVPALWGNLEESISRIPDAPSSDKHMRPQTEILEELVAGVRGLNSRIRDFGSEREEREYHHRMRRYGHFHPRMFKDLMDASIYEENNPIALLMLAGMFKDDFPWLSEIITEAYREIKNGDDESAEKVLRNLYKTLINLRKTKFMERLYGGSKRAHNVMLELPHIIENLAMQCIESNDLSEDDII